MPRDVNEQRKIAAVLSLAWHAVEQQERILSLTAELKKALLDQLFTQGARQEPQKQSELGKIPQSWRVTSVGSLADITHGYAFASKHFTSSGSVVLTPGNFRLNGGLYWGDKTKFTSEKCSNDYQFKLGDLVIVMTDLTPSAKLLGTPAFIPEGRVILHNQRIGKVVPTTHSTNPQFLYWVFLTDAFKKHMVLTATGSTVRHTSPSRIKDFQFALPTSDEQIEITSILKAVDGRMAIVESKRAALSTLFRTLLHELMTPRVRVHNLDLLELEAAASK